MPLFYCKMNKRGQLVLLAHPLWPAHLAGFFPEAQLSRTGMAPQGEAQPSDLDRAVLLLLLSTVARSPLLLSLTMTATAERGAPRPAAARPPL